MTELSLETLKRQAIRRLCRRYPDGLYLFTKAVCGFDRLSWDLHRGFANFIQLHPFNGGPPRSYRKHAWMPREHFKSTICSIAFPLWLLSCVDRNLTIALISADNDNTKKWLRAIKEIIKYNGFFRWLYPEIRPGEKWDEEEIIVRRDREYGTDVQASITAYSINSGLASQHHSYIVLDDPVNEQVAGSAAMMADAVRLFIHLEEILRGWKQSGFLLVDTPWGREDPHHVALQEERRGYRLKWGIGVYGEFELSAALADRPELTPTVEPGQPILPSECDEDKLELIKSQDMSKYFFHYLCKPYEAGRNGFTLDLIRDFSLFPDGRMQCECHRDHYHSIAQGSTVAVSDPAYTPDKKNCESAILIIHEQPCGCRFLLEEWGDHVHLQRYYNTVCDIAGRWKTWLGGFGIESEHVQSAMGQVLREMKASGTFPLGVEILELKPKRRAKDLRIGTQIAYVNNGQWHKRPTMQHLAGLNNLLQQLYQWPYSNKRDRADAFGYANDAFEMKPPRRDAQAALPGQRNVPGINRRREDADMAAFQQELSA